MRLGHHSGTAKQTHAKCRTGDYGYQENGRPCAASNDPIPMRRAEESIEIYHLYYEPTCKRRQHCGSVDGGWTKGSACLIWQHKI